MIALDHIALGAMTLRQGVRYVRHVLDVTVPFGGVHAGMGTHNALTATGGGSYLEIIAPDPDQNQPSLPRAFDLDKAEVRTALEKSPLILTYLLRTDNIERDLQIARDAGFDLGTAETMSRGDLCWKISLRPDRSLIAGGAMPLLIEWPAGPHVSTGMADKGLLLDSLNIASPQAQEITNVLEKMGFSDQRVTYQTADTAGLIARFLTQDGRLVTLGL